MSDRDKFAVLRKSKRVWAVAAIHGEAEKLASLHRALEPRIVAGDRLVYLGNYLGHGPDVRATLDALLAFRRELIARPGMFAADVAYLRGSQEEMWQKLLQLQFAPNPREVFAWMVEHGAGATLTTYGGEIQQGFVCTRDGPLAITRWTSKLRAAMQAVPRPLRADERAAPRRLHRRRRPAVRPCRTRCLTARSRLRATRCGGVRAASRSSTAPTAASSAWSAAFERAHAGIQTSQFTASIDGGCGFGGPLVAACFDKRGDVVDSIEA
jgi:serine/threonine protein phosphatase 1